MKVINLTQHPATPEQVETELKTVHETVEAVKALDKDFRCRGFQYAIGQTYHHDGPVVICNSGFHACENPLDTLSYYDVTKCRFALVEQSGELRRHAEDTKVASAEIAIKAELRLPEFIKRAVDWMLANAKDGAASGDDNCLAASGDDNCLAASGFDSRIAASGDRSRIAASGDCSRIAASGDCSRIAASGDGSRIAASGDGSRIAASGDYSRIAAAGDGSHIAASGVGSRIAASGVGSRVKLGENGCAVLAWHDGKRPRFTVLYVGEDGIKPGTWYRLDDDGRPVECRE